mgnify:CR=1 FL=1
MRENSAGQWLLVVPSVVALGAGLWNVGALVSMFTSSGSFAWWLVSGFVALIALVMTLVALIVGRAQRAFVVGLAAAGLFVAGGALLLDLFVGVFSSWLAAGLGSSGS